MKELLSIATNMAAVILKDGTLQANVEVVVVVTEPVYSVNAIGELVQSRANYEHRFAASPDQLRSMGDVLYETATKAEQKLAAALTHKGTKP